VLLAAHGAGDSAEWQCAFWQGVVEHRGFVLCPRGKRLSSRDESGYYYENHLALEREVDASLAALEQKEGKRARTTTVTYVGYSQGATMGALMARAHPDRFRRLALIEGGYAEYSAPVARAFARGGAERVLFVCGIKTCRDKARRSGLWLEQAGLLVRLEYVEGGGHTYLGTVGDRARSAFEWLIDGDPLWAKSGT
jgi:pimeloyl-ACP methyl ester carboxylesterase